MQRFWLCMAALTALSACGGDGTNPFDKSTETDIDPPPGVPDQLVGDLEGVTYDPVRGTLVVRGIAQDGAPYAAEYRRRPGMDRKGYEAYTAQESSLTPHATAYVKQIGDTGAAIVSTGGQFAYYVAGSTYSNTGTYSAPTPTAGNPKAVATYSGNYVGLLNIPGDGNDLHPVTPGTDPNPRPTQAAEVTGRVQITAGFVDNRISGLVYDRSIEDSPATRLGDLELSPTDIDRYGTFTAEVTQLHQNKGSYGGVFGGPDAEVVAGTLFAENHIEGIANIEERGLFVLGQCGTVHADPLCNQPVP